MYRATALLGIARETGILDTVELGRLLRLWQNSGESVSFEQWGPDHELVSPTAARALALAFQRSTFRCLHCMATLDGDQLDGTVFLHCPFCHSAAVKRDAARQPAVLEPSHPPARDESSTSPTRNDVRPDLFRAPPSGLSDLALPETAEQTRQLRATIESDRRIEAGLGSVELLGRWVITDHVGDGGMASVWKAYNESIDQYAAVKVLELTEPAELIERFRREARACGRLDHPNIVRIREVGRCWGKACIVMEWVDGESLDTTLRKQHLLPVGDVLHVAIQAAKGLQAAHTAGVIHRDVKPGNLLRRRADGLIKIVDFGLARVRDAAIRLTRSGTVVGTPLYMAPEQVRDEEIGPATDIYALGATIFHLLTGTPPYEGATGGAVLHQHVAAPFPLARQRRPDVLASLDHLLQEMTAKSPADRPASMSAVIDQLREISRQQHQQQSGVKGRDGTPGSTTSTVVPTLTEIDYAGSPPQTVLIDVPARPDSRFWLQAELLLDQVRTDGARYVVLDLSACDALQSSGIATLLHMREEAARWQVEVILAAPRDRVRIVLELMGVHNFMPVTTTVQDAIDSTGHFRFRRVRAAELDG